MGDDVIADQSRVEGWNGALSNDELLHTTAYGHEQHGFDRPLQFAADQDAVTENARLQELAHATSKYSSCLTKPVRYAKPASSNSNRGASS